MNTYTAVKERLLQLLEVKKLSIHKLSLESGVSPSTIKNILYGKSINPGVVTIKMLCDGFGITLKDFFESEKFIGLEDNE
ncbi:MAG TPA: helix-turn-helix transcriptional regulator [Candidatus Coproplasma stercorigallinarum]|nr:helix-turn-helix transcriptional regulator [Candidatus Coproplasma stercorigallinarum]